MQFIALLTAQFLTRTVFVSQIPQDHTTAYEATYYTEQCDNKTKFYINTLVPQH